MASVTTPGFGEIYLTLLFDKKQVLSTFTYEYPLKLIAPDAHKSATGKHVTVVFLLSYGGGLVGGDKISLKMSLDDNTRLALLTQGSTKIFKSPDAATVSHQVLDVKIGKGASLCYLPDPTQPFKASIYEQRQTFYIDPAGSSSLLMLDWVSGGRRACGESWTLSSWKGCNEVRQLNESLQGRLLLRDAVMLHEEDLGADLAQKTHNMGVFGTLIVYGPTFHELGDFIMQEFGAQPRIGAKAWDHGRAQTAVETAARSKQAAVDDGLLWTAASVRGFVVVKFGSTEVDGARRWLGSLLRRQGTVETEFGHRSLLCLR
ncbi:MAG: hypothetical protein Q9221_004162 [Calogaya cf. arnoldii]